MITPIVTTILGNEKAYAYFEVNQQAPDSSGFQRYRVIFVNRDGRVAEYRESMGKASQFKGVRQISIPSFFEHSVEELRGIADELRNLDDDRLDLDELLELDRDNYKLA